MSKREKLWILIEMLGLVALLQLVIVSVTLAQDVTAPAAGGFDPLGDPRFAAFFLAAALVNRTVEFVKPRIRDTQFSNGAQTAMLTFVAVAGGVFVAFTSNINLVTSYPAIPKLAGTVMTGAVIGAGADVLNLVITLLYAVRDFLTTSNNQRILGTSDTLRRELGQG